MRNKLRTGRTVSAILFALVLGCNAAPDTRYYLARPLSSRGLAWEIYTGGTWKTVELQGIRAPSYVAENVLAGGNYFMFAGKYLEPGVLEFRAWNILPPIWRVASPGSPPDTTGLPWLTGDDFAKLEDYQRFSLLAAAEQWPWRGHGIESPDSLRRLFKK